MAEEPFPYVEVRRKGLRYIAHTREEAERISLPSPLAPEEGTLLGKKIDELKAKAVNAANAAVPGVSEMAIMEARKTVLAHFTFPEDPPLPLTEWLDDRSIHWNAALFLHYFFNALGFSYQDEAKVREAWDRMVPRR